MEDFLRAGEVVITLFCIIVVSSLFVIAIAKKFGNKNDNEQR